MAITDELTVEYKTLTAQERLNIANEFLRARETEHYRLYLSAGDDDPSRDARLAPMTEAIKKLQAEADKLEKAATKS